MNYQTVLRDVESLPVDDQIELVHEMWERLVEKGHEAELDRRLATVNRKSEAGLPWEAAKARILERLREQFVS